MSNTPSNPPISIILTVNDSVQLFEKSLNSCLNQSYAPKEVIVVNHGTDNSIEKFIENEESFTYLPLSGVSLSKGRNIALEHCKGEYVVFVTQDQEIQEMWLDKAVTRLRLSQADGFQCGTMYEKDGIIAHLGVPNDSIFGFYTRLLIKNTIPLNSIILKSSICSRFPEDKGEEGEWEFLINTLRGKKVDVQPEFIGSIIHLAKDESYENVPKQSLEIMKKY
jgi:glycosyltransferase involved in cell wall biosynthesis